MGKKDSGLVAGIDLGGTSIAVGIVDTEGRIRGAHKRKTKAATGLEAVLGRIEEAVARACEEAHIGAGQLDAVGIGAPSAINIDEGVVINAGNLGWKNVPLRELLEKRLSRRVVVDNDVNAAAWGEAQVGAARSWKDLLAVWVGTGIGGGLVLNGELWRGSFHTAGEIGQMSLMPRGGAGRRTLEEHCSRVSMVRAMETLAGFYPDSSIVAALARREPGELLGSRQIGLAYAEGDELCRRVVDDAAELLGMAIANAVTLLSVKAVVLGGGVTDALGDRYFGLVRDAFEASVFPSTLRKCRFVASELGDDAGIIGAALLARGG
jgi:glucokinase